MNDVVADGRGSLLHRVMQTPLRRLVRGKIGPGLTVDDVVASLPIEAATAVRDVVRRTRLWRTEKLSVAEELASHFHDGLDAGASANDLVRDFGDPRTAAKLIRRAKIRNRPMVWHITRWTLRGVAALILLYIAAGLYYLTGEPKPSVDYVARFQAPIKAVPEEDRAWPLYRRALVGMGELPQRISPDDLPQPGEAAWEPIGRYLTDHQDQLALIREAAAQPALGYVVGEIDEADRVLWPKMQHAVAGEDELEGAMIGLLLPHIQELQKIERVLLVDLRRAVAAGDADAALADIEAMLGLAMHNSEGGLLITDLVALNMLDRATDEVQRLLAGRPELLSDAQWVRIAHRLAAVEPILEPSYDGERMIFHDIVQRLYTPGEDGSLSFSGWRNFSMLAPPSDPPSDGLTLLAIYPAAAGLTLSRGEVLAEYDRLLSHAVARTQQPMWQWQGHGPDAEVTGAMSQIDRLRAPLIALMMPSGSRAALHGEWRRAERDAVQVAIALELYRRRHGEYPTALEQMVPALLPQVPPDRFTGQPVRYRIANGSLAVYSVGVDRDDDGGRAALHEASQPDPAKEWMPVEQLPPASDVEGAARIDGDWVLYDPAG